MITPRRARLASVMLGLTLAALSLAPRPARAQDISCEPGDTEVWRLHFEGNRAFTDAQLESGLVTTPSTWARRAFRFIGTRHCIDPLEMRRDSLRLLLFYRGHGYTEATVGLRVQPVRPRAVDVTFTVHEGTPVRISQFTVAGLDSFPPARRVALLRGLPVQQGGPFDKYAIEAARDTLIVRLRNSGYPTSDVLREFQTDDSTRTATVQFNVSPGPLAHIGKINITVDSAPRGGSRAQISKRSIRNVLGVKPGDLYRQRDLETAKRNLFLTDAFSLVSIAPDSTSLRAADDSTIDISVSVVETYLRSARASLGWGSLDCLRAQGSYTDVNFLGGIRRLELNGRVSKIGIGKPLDFASTLCPQARQDLFSDTLNYYVGATIRQPALFGIRTIPSVTVYSERRSEYNAFLRTTPVGALVSLNRQPRPTLPMTFAYQLEYGRTEAQPAIFCALFNICQPADRDVLRRTKRLAVASWSVTRNRADNLFDPTRGSVARLELRHASTLIGSESDLQFSKAVADASWYFSVSDASVLVGRLRLGAVFGQGRTVAGAGFIPPQERLYAGGPNTVRGFTQNELGPAVYIPTGNQPYDTVVVAGETYFRTRQGQSARAVPTGGNTSVVANLEYRFRSPILPELVQWSLFTDAGQVWNRGADSTQLNFKSIKVTPGLGVRVFSPVGPIRVDVGYNPYQRPNGAAYYNAPVQAGGRLYCVSPDNRLPVTLRASPLGEPLPAEQEPGVCRASFQPSRTTGFFERLTLGFSIGQAF